MKQRILPATFTTLLAAAVIGGILIVGSQAVGLIIQDSTVLTWSSSWLAPLTFSISVVAGGFAFLMTYTRKSTVSDTDDSTS